MTAQKVKTKTVKRECPSYTKVCLHESKESNRGSEGDRREEIACSSEKTSLSRKKNHKANIPSVQGKVSLQRKKVCSFRLEAVSNMISSNEISVQQD